MKKRYLVSAVAMIFMATSLLGCGSPVSKNSEVAMKTEEDSSLKESKEEIDMEPTTWTCVTYVDSSSKHYAQQADMCEAIYERTNGLLDIQLYSVGEFSFKGTDMLSVTADRTVEMTIPSLSYIEGESVISSIVELSLIHI